MEKDKTEEMKLEKSSTEIEKNDDSAQNSENNRPDENIQSNMNAQSTENGQLIDNEQASLNVENCENSQSDESASSLTKNTDDELQTDPTGNKKNVTDAQENGSEHEVAPEEIIQPAEGGNNADVDNVDGDDEKISEQSNRKMNSRLKALIYTLCIFAVSIILAFTILYSYTDYIGFFRSDKSSSVTIPKNASLGQVADILKSDGIIRSPITFKAYITFGKKKGIKPGRYKLDSQMSYSEIVTKLQCPQELHTVRVTIPEGYTLQKIGALLQKDKICTKESFLKSADSAKIKFDFQSQIPNDKNRFYRLEGYLFPDTYDFYVNESSESVIKKMLDNFDSRFDSSLRKKAKLSGMTVDQIITLASIIQKEAGKKSEMSRVSSVFHNRLEKGIGSLKMLQSDATYFYIKYVIKMAQKKADSQTETAYNTYKHKGLTPGAICNPGLDAIKAALNPEKTSYYFFVTDVNSKYYYAETWAGQQANVQKAYNIGKAKGTNVRN